MDGLTISLVNEYEITEKQRGDILALLQACFPGYFKERIYFKQIPKERYLVYKDSELIAQMGVDFRVIRIRHKPYTIIGVADIAVKESLRNQGIGSLLLKKIDTKAIKYGIHYALLFADEHKLYLNNGYRLVKNECTWLGIDEHQSIGIMKDRLSDCMLLKALSVNSNWNNDDAVDLLGFLF